MKTLDLKSLRKAKNLTQDDLAEILGFTTNGFISQIETGHKDTPRKVEERLAELYGDLSAYYIETSESDEDKMIELPQSVLDEIKKHTNIIECELRAIKNLLNTKI